VKTAVTVILITGSSNITQLYLLLRENLDVVGYRVVIDAVQKIQSSPITLLA
jgi:hypothetical protein